MWNNSGGCKLQKSRGIFCAFRSSKASFWPCWLKETLEDTSPQTIPTAPPMSGRPGGKKRLTNIIYQKSSGCNLMRFFAPKLNCIRIPIKIPKWWSDRPIFWQTKPLTGNEETSQRLACWSMETINKSGPAKFKMDLEKKHDVLESRLNVKFLGVYFIPFGGFVSL